MIENCTAKELVAWFWSMWLVKT